MPEFVTIGETCAVLVSKKIGRMRYTSEFELRPGGAESTVAVGVRRLGHGAGWISHLGKDEFGYYILNFIRGEGIDVSNVKLIQDKSTGVFFRERLAGGEARHFYYRTGSAFSDIRPEYLSENYIASAKILHVTGISPALSESCLQTIKAAVKIAKKHKTLVTFDPNLRLKLWTIEEAKPILEDLMVSADYVLPGLEEMHAIYGQKTAREILDYLHRIGCQRIILKLGKEGAMLSQPSGHERITGYPVNDPADLMGAGDAFAAGFISGLLKGMDLQTSIDLANLVASLSIQLPGNIESLPTLDEIEQYKKGKTPTKR